MKSSFQIAVLISGNGSNLQAIIDAIEQNQIPATINVVISNQPNAYGLERARQHGIETEVIQKSDFADRASFDLALTMCLKAFNPDLIVLAGFMHILSHECVQQFAGKIINIHPALLPKYRGLHTHQRVLQTQDQEHGSTVHLVTAELDAGQIIAQSRLMIDPEDTPATLEERIKHLEHSLYPFVIELFAKGCLTFNGTQLLYNNQPLPQNGLQLGVS